MFKATLDGNGLVIYSDQPGGEVLADMTPINSVYDAPLLNLEPSVVLKGAFASKYEFTGASFEETYALVDYKPFWGIVTGPISWASNSTIINYLLERHPDLKIIGVEVEYKELVGTTIPVALDMWAYVAGDWSTSIDPFFVRNPTGSTEWQIARIDLLSGKIHDGDVCPFKSMSSSGITPTGGPAEYFDNKSKIANCFMNIGLWPDSLIAPEALKMIYVPRFHICGGVGAVRRISFHFASSQFWNGFENSTELIQLYERPAPPVPNEPQDPDDPPVLIPFEGGAWTYILHPEHYTNAQYPTIEDYNSEYEAHPLNVGIEGVPWLEPFSIISAGGGPGGIAVQYEDGNNVKWHIGSNGGGFRFYADGRWRFDSYGMFWDVPIDEERETYVDIIIADEYYEYRARAVAIISGQAPLVAPDQYTLRPRYFKADAMDGEGTGAGQENFTGNVFSNAHEPSGWTVTKFMGQAGYVGVQRSTTGMGPNSVMQVDANGDFKVWVGNGYQMLATEEYPNGFVFTCYGYYEATKGGQTRTQFLNLHVTMDLVFEEDEGELEP